jgi:hypothetical protein
VIYLIGASNFLVIRESSFSRISSDVRESSGVLIRTHGFFFFFSFIIIFSNAMYDI